MKLKDLIKKSTITLLVGLVLTSNAMTNDVGAESYSYSGKNGPAYTTNLVVPTNLVKGQSCSVSGEVNVKAFNTVNDSWYCGIAVYESKYLNDSLKIRLTHSIASASERSTQKPASQKTYNLSYLDSDIVFGSLALGKYAYTVYAICGGSMYIDVYTGLFVVSGYGVNEAHYSGNNASLTNYRVPNSIKEGDSYSLTGLVNMTYNKYKSDGKISRTTYPHSMFASVKEGDKYVTSSAGYYSTNGKANESPIFSEQKRTFPIPSALDNGIVFGDTNKFKKNHTYTLSYSIAHYNSENTFYSGRSVKILERSFSVK